MEQVKDYKQPWKDRPRGRQVRASAIHQHGAVNPRTRLAVARAEWSGPGFLGLISYFYLSSTNGYTKDKDIEV